MTKHVLMIGSMLVSIMVSAIFMFVSCGGDSSSSTPAQTYGTIKFVNHSGHEVYYFRERNAGDGAESWNFHSFTGGTMPNNSSAYISGIKTGQKDIRIDYHGSTPATEYMNVLGVQENPTTVFEKTASSYNVSNESSNSGGGTGGSDGGTSGNGGNCNSCSSDSTYTGWYNKCANSTSQAACYCASAYLKKCCGDSSWSNDYNTAGQLGTRCW